MNDYDITLVYPGGAADPESQVEKLFQLSDPERMLLISNPVKFYDSLDTYYLDKIVLIELLNDKVLRDNMGGIARDFYANELNNIRKIETIEYLPSDIADRDYYDFPDGVGTYDVHFYATTLNRIMTLYRHGSEYSTELMQMLCKRYLKSFYRIVKRYSHITFNDYGDIGRTGDGINISVMCVCNFIAELCKIPSDPNTKSLRVVARNHYLSSWKSERKIGPIKESALRDALAEVESFIDEIPTLDDKRRTNTDLFFKRFCQYILYDARSNLGGLPKFAQHGDEYQCGVIWALVKEVDPNVTFSPDEFGFYVDLFHIADNVVYIYLINQSLLDTVTSNNVDKRFLEKEFYLKDSTDRTATKPEKQKSEPEQKNNSESNDFVKYIHDLQDQINILKTNNQELHNKLSDSEHKVKELTIADEKRENLRKELTSLRSYVYHLTESDIQENNVSIDEMGKLIGSKRILIVGGHQNWVTKLQNLFPNWKFIADTVSGARDLQVLNSVDHVYFFTDTLSHKTYYLLIDSLRDKNIPFGYIHQVNVESNIRQIYNDLK